VEQLLSPYGNNQLLISGVQTDGTNATRGIWITPAQAAPGDYHFLDPKTWTPLGNIPTQPRLDAEPTAGLFHVDTLPWRHEQRCGWFRASITRPVSSPVGEFGGDERYAAKVDWPVDTHLLTMGLCSAHSSPLRCRPTAHSLTPHPFVIFVTPLR